MNKIISMASSPEQAESIASHILLMLIRDLGIMEISNVRVKLDGIEEVDAHKLDEIVTSLVEFNTDQILKFCDLSLDELEIDNEL